MAECGGTHHNSSYSKGEVWNDHCSRQPQSKKLVRSHFNKQPKSGSPHL
jgi:hypothetical protein